MIYKERKYKGYVQVDQRPYSKPVYKCCRECGQLIVVKEFESYYIQNPNSWLFWKKHGIKSWFCTFEADNPDLKHEHDICTDEDWEIFPLERYREEVAA